MSGEDVLVTGELPLEPGDRAVVLLVDELTPELAVRAHRAGARVCLRAHGPEALREAVAAAARERAARRALEELEQVRALVNVSVADVIFRLDVEGDRFRFREINPMFTRATGLEEAQVVGKLVDEVIPEPSLSLVLARYREAIAGRRTVRWDEETPYPTGKKYGEVSVTPVVNARGEVTSLIGTVHDVTEERLLDQQIRLHADVMRSVQIGLLVWDVPDPADPAGMTLAGFNPEAERLSAVPLAGAIGRPVFELYPAQRGSELVDLMCAVARDGQVREVPVFPTPGGRSLRLKIFPLAGGGRVALASEDVTGQVQARALATAEQQVFELTARGAPLAAILAPLLHAVGELLAPATAEVLPPDVGEAGAPIVAGDGRILGRFVIRHPSPRPPGAEEEAMVARAAHVAAIAMQRQELDEGLRGLSARIEAAREDERTGIAREIHDQIGQSITALKMELAFIARRAASPAGLAREALVDKLRALAAMTDEMIAEVRRISAELRPGILDDLGLVAALSWQAREFEERTQVTTVFRSELGDRKLPRELATTAFRVFQEALTNIVRHADARRVDVEVAERDGELILDVRDDGRGIGAEALRDPRSLGLLGMSERARRLGGSATFARGAPTGTVVTLRLPLR